MRRDITVLSFPPTVKVSPTEPVPVIFVSGTRAPSTVYYCYKTKLKSSLDLDKWSKRTVGTLYVSLNV